MLIKKSWAWSQAQDFLWAENFWVGLRVEHKTSTWAWNRTQESFKSMGPKCTKHTMSSLTYSISFLLHWTLHQAVSLTLSQTTNFRLFQTEKVCRRQFWIWWKWQTVFQMGRKHCGKRRNCSLRAISHLPTVFSKDLYCRHVKCRACFGKGYLLCKLDKNLSMFYFVNPQLVDV